MKKTKELLKEEFESSSSQTEQYLNFHRTFKKEFTKMMNPICSEIQISKPNHFDLSGFFKTNIGKIYYINIGDLRWNKERMLYRTAKDFKDYTGGSNGFFPTNKLEDFAKLISSKE